MAFSDGIRVGAVLDRNGLRPSRYWVTDDNFVVMSSEVGVLEIPQHKIIKKGRLEPGRTFLIDTEQATHRRKISAPSVLVTLIGATTLPTDFDIFMPLASTVKPCVSTCL